MARPAGGGHLGDEPFASSSKEILTLAADDTVRHTKFGEGSRARR